MKRPVTLALAVALAAVLTVGLSGCVNPVEAFVKGATKGKVDIAGASVPSSFPKSVPLYPGKVTSGVELGQDDDYIWNVIMVVPGPEVMKTIAGELRKAGFTTDLDTGDDDKTLIFDDADYDVAVVLKTSGSRYTVDYAVSTQQDDDEG